MSIIHSRRQANRAIILLLLSLLLALPTNSMSDSGQTPFTQSELNTFCEDLPKVLESIDKESSDQYFHDILEDYDNTIFHRKPLNEFPSELSPTRFNYILNHTLLAGVVREMGGFGDAKLAFLREQHNKITQTNRLSKTQKQIELDKIEASLAQVQKLKKQAEAIPRTELLLLLPKEDRLNEILRDVVPMKPKQMKRE